MNRRRERCTKPVTAVLALALGAAVLAGCGLSDDLGGFGDEARSTTTASSTPGPTESTSTTVEGELPSGAPVEGCVEGWTTPAPGTPKRQEPLDLIRAEMGLSGLFKVTAMRYFQGPELPWITDVRPPFVDSSPK